MRRYIAWLVALMFYGSILSWNVNAENFNISAHNVTSDNGAITGFKNITGDSTGSISGFSIDNSLVNIDNAYRQSAPWVDVRSFGAACDNATNDNAAFKLANDYLVTLGGGKIIVSKNCVAQHIDLGSNVGIQCTGWGSGIRQVTGTDVRTQADGLITINRNNAASTVDNVMIRDCKLSMDTLTAPHAGTDEHKHLIMTGNVSNILIDHVLFSGWKGDAVTLGVQGLAPSTESVAKGVTIRDSYFDGLTNMGRQGISLLSVDGALIENNDFTRTTAALMPGAICLEPELVTGYGRNISIRNNRFVNIGPAGTRRRAFVIDLGNMTDNTYHDRVRDIAFSHNTTDNTTGLSYVGSAALMQTTRPQNFTVEGNHFLNSTIFPFEKLDGLFVCHNTFFNTSGTMIFGATGGVAANRVKFIGNVLDNCGAAGNAAVSIYNTTDMDMSGNTYKDSGDGGGIALLAGGVTKSLRIHNEDFSAPDNVLHTSITVSGTHTMDNTVKFYDLTLRDSVAAPTGWTGGYPESTLPVYDNNAAALEGGMASGMYYSPTSDNGAVRIVR